MTRSAGDRWLANAVAIVSGGAHGTAAAEARALAQAGPRVVIGAVLDEEGERVAASFITGTGLVIDGGWTAT